MSMNQTEMESLLIEYIDGTLTEDQTKEVEKLLVENADARKLEAELRQVLQALDHTQEVVPSSRLTARFAEALATEIHETKRAAGGQQVLMHPVVLRIAASLVVIIGMGLMGYWFTKSYQQQQELEALRKEMEQTKQLMFSMLDVQQPASQRMTAANVAFGLKEMDDDIVQVLSETMINDPNSNVRLAALEALGKFHQQPHVRKTLVQSLAHQSDPIVQIALIRLLVEIKETDVLKELHKITSDELVLPAVKTEAHAGILRLS
jgi:anti-sigma-K factor RskA